MYRITVYIPASHLEIVKTAMFHAGAGRIGHYECCSWQTLGQGQFRPLAGSQPFLGSQDTLETVEEYQVEMVCETKCVREVIAALKKSHPYEQPAYMVSEIVSF